jgi:hypothetical protein
VTQQNLNRDLQLTTKPFSSITNTVQNSQTNALPVSGCQKYNFVLNDVIKLNSKGMKEDLGVGIAFYIICSPVQFFYNCLLLTDIGKAI